MSRRLPLVAAVLACIGLCSACAERIGPPAGFTIALFDSTMVHFTPDSFVTDGDQVAMFGRCCWTHRQTQNTAECHIAHLWTFNNGKVTNFTEVFDSARAAAAAMP